MDPKLRYQGRVDEAGDLTIHRRGELIQDLRELFKGREVVITIQVKRRKRSLDQNSYYWGVVVPMAREGLRGVGYHLSKSQTHSLLKDHFARDYLVNEDTGEILKIRGSTAGMTTLKFEEYLAEIRDWAEDYLSIKIPKPNEQTKIEYYDTTD